MVDEKFKGDSTAAVEFLRRWAPEGPWVLTAIDPERKQKLITQTFDKDPEALAFVNHWNGVRNLYFSVNVPRTAITSKAEKADIGWLSALHVDIDPGKEIDLKDQAAWDAEKERILSSLRAYEPKPSVIIFSGGGYQGFWLMAQPVEIEETGKDPWAPLEAYNRKLEKDLGGDHCFNVDRIMRLPGTVNLPDAKKRGKGRVPALALVTDADWDRLYGLKNFEPYKAPTKAKAKETGPAPERPKHEPPEWVTRVLANGPDHEGPKSYGGDRSKALWAVCCSLIRLNWPPKDIAELILDKTNKLSEHVYAQSDPEKYALRQANRAKEYAGGDFTYDKKGNPLASQENVRVAFTKLDIILSFDEFARRPMIEGPEGKPKRKMEDRDVHSVYLTIAREFNFRPAIELFRMMITDECYARSYHPVRMYLDSLKWDGVPRIDSWLIKYGQAEDTPFVRAVGTLSLLAGVRRIKQPGVKFDEIIIFESPQGYNKSTALSILATRPEWFTDSMPLNADDKLMIEALEGKWLVESPELKGMRRSDVEHHKAMLSRQYDRARLSYGHFTTEVPRQCVFFGSTNADSYLRDTTGNRRFWPIKVGQFDIEALRADVHQIWAEAVLRESTGESIRLAPELYPAATLEQNRRTVEDPWEQLIEQCLNGFDSGKILAADIWNIVQVPVPQRTQEHNVRLGDSMRNLGWDRKKLRFNPRELPKWGYAKGDAEERSLRIYINRDDIEGLNVRRDSSSDGPLEEAAQESVDKDIPF